MQCELNLWLRIGLVARTEARMTRFLFSWTETKGLVIVNDVLMLEWVSA